MKKIIYLTVLTVILSVNIGSAQEITKQDTTEIKKDTVEPNMGAMIVEMMNDINNIVDKIERYEDEDEDERKFKSYWDGFEIGVNGYLDKYKSIALSPSADFMELETNKSFVVNINLWDKGFNLIKNHFGIITGLGLGINNYNFERNITLIPDSIPISYSQDTIHNLQKNKLTVTYLKVPLMLGFQTLPQEEKRSQNSRLHIETGIIGGIKIGSHTKQKYAETDKKVNKEKIRDDFNLNPFTYEITARIGYRNTYLFANYSLSTLFEKNKGPELYPFIIGLGFTF